MDIEAPKTLKNASQIHETNEAQSYEPPNYTQHEILLTMLGVLMVMLLASLDQTIVSTAMPRVIADLSGFNHYTWVSTAYLLTSTVMVPIYGKLSDLYGRKSIFLIGIVIFLLGSALSGASRSMNQLILYRAFQGLGAAALMPIAIAIVGDLFTPRERGKWQGLTGAVWGFSSIVGPLLGGWITETTSWRWVFYVNVPIGIAALLVLIFLMPALHTQGQQQVQIDYLGAIFLILGTIPLLLGFTWAGSTYPWLSFPIIGLFAFALVFLVAFVLYELKLEREQREPIIQPSLFRNRTFTISSIVTAIFGMGLFGSTFFIPLFVQGVIGTSATSSGIVLTPLLLTSMVSSILAGQLVARLGRYKWIAVSGMAISVMGTLLMMRLNIASTNGDVVLSMLVLGFGMGFSMSLYTLIVQNALPNKIGVATSALVFFRSIGGTIALAAMGSILGAAYQPAFHQALSPQVRASVPPQILNAFNDPNILLSPQEQAKAVAMFQSLGPQGNYLYHQVTLAVKVALTTGLHNVFMLSTAIMLVGLVAVFFLPELRLHGNKDEEERAEKATSTGGFSPMSLH